jgi:hypothetical protein
MCEVRTLHKTLIHRHFDLIDTDSVFTQYVQIKFY